MVPLAEAVVALPPLLLAPLELELLAAVPAGTLAGEALVEEGLALLELAAAVSVLPASLEPPQPASATLRPMMAMPCPMHALYLRLLPLFISLAPLPEGEKPFKALRRGASRTARVEC
jgi:hypothetical protein